MCIYNKDKKKKKKNHVCFTRRRSRVRTSPEPRLFIFLRNRDNVAYWSHTK